MTDEEINKRIHKIIGLCWHENELDNCEYDKLDIYKCNKCRRYYSDNMKSVNTWVGFGILWEFMQKHEQFSEFILIYGGQDFIQKTSKSGEYEDYLRIEYISPPALAKAVMEFL